MAENGGGSSIQINIRAEVCPCGHVNLYLGRLCLYLRKDEFLYLAQVMRSTEKSLLERTLSWQGEQEH